MKITANFFLAGILSFSLLFIFAGCQTSSTQQSKSIDLFNGRDFTGWTFFMKTNADPMQTWSITNGMIHCTGRPTGYLRTKKRFHDFKVTVEWRFTKAGNTGVLVFMQDRDPAAGPDQIWPHCIECQGMHNQMGNFWLQGGATAREPVNLGKNGIKRLEPSNESPLGEWTTFQSICRSNTVEIVVNGKSMNKITGVDVSSGYIGIQSESAGIDIRKMFLEPLKAP